MSKNISHRFSSSTDGFRMKRFAVEHSQSTMKVGTDAVLLGAWCRVDVARRVLDVGTGCGVVALMVAQRAEMALVDAIDLDVASVAEARRNFDASPWRHRLRAAQADFNLWEGDYDLVVSNPPFFASSLLPHDALRAAARHARSLTYERLIARSRQLLAATKGRLAVVTPAEARAAMIESAAMHAMGIERLCEVVPVEGKGIKRLLWELTPVPSAPMRRECITLADAGGQPTEDYRTLCHDFYLKF